MTTTTATTRATLEELLGRLSRFEPEPVAALFTEPVDWDVPGDARVPWVGARSRREEVAAYFRTLWSVCDTGQTDTAVSQVLVDGSEAVCSACSPRRSAPPADASRRRWQCTSRSTTG